MKALNIRNVPDDVARRFKAEAALRGLTLAQYLAVLMGEPR